MKLILDFETANTEGVDLPTVGADVYAAHPATEILCLCVMTEDGDPWCTWKPGDRTGVQQLDDLAADPEVVFEAHNAAFEQMIWKHIMYGRFGFTAIPISRWSCSMARSYAHGLPGSLDKLAAALDLPEQKDKEGSGFTIALSSPMSKKDWAASMPVDWIPADKREARLQKRSKKSWLDTWKPTYDRRPETLACVEEYCWSDCRIEHLAGLMLPELSPYERRVWEADQLINQRGVKIDRKFVEAAIQIINDAENAKLARFSDLTGGLAPGQLARVAEWIEQQGVKVPTKINAKGERVKTLDVAAVDSLIGKGDGDAETGVVPPDCKLPPAVYEVLAVRRLLGASAIDKYPRMLACAGPDDRARYTTQYHGAHTGRWAGRLFQPQNFPRASLPDFDDPDENLDPEIAVAAFLSGDYRLVEDLFGGKSAIWCAGRVLRHALIAERGHIYDSADYAGIEMRIDLALAGEGGKCEMLAGGQDVYVDMAKIIGRDRTTGKNTVLGCGFGMGADKFHGRYGQKLTLAECRDIITAYRNEWAPGVPKLWDTLEAAALKAVQNPGREVTALCGVTYVLRTSWLQCHLPDGQVLWYREPRICEGKFGNPAWQYRTYGKDGWVDVYGGLLCENVCQKLARGLLCEAIHRLEQNGFPVVLTVHDEILAEPMAGSDHKAFEQIMAERPAWAAHLPAALPIAVEGWQGPRYRK